MKPEAKKTALSNCCLVIPGQVFLSLYRFLSGPVRRSLGEGGSPFIIRHSSFVILLVASCSFFFSTSANAQSLPKAPAVDDLDCITAYDADDAPLQICEDSSDPWNDLDEISLPEEKNGLIPSRHDQATPHFTTTTVTVIALHQPGIIPAFLLPTDFSSSLREHIRERAPPSLV